MKTSSENFDLSNMFAQNIEYERLSEAVLMSTHNLCFFPEIRKIVYPCISQCYYKSGV